MPVPTSPPTGGPSPTVPLPALVLRFAEGGAVPAERPVAVETAVQVVIGAVPFAVMMATPRDLEDFAYGFCLTEGIVRAASEVRGVTLEAGPDGMRLDVAVAPERLHGHLARRRALAGRTGCGVCGIDDLAALARARPVPPGARAPVPLAAIAAALEALPAAQALNRETGAVHAAALADEAGKLLLVREDVGRHNALDKLIGAALRAGIDPAAGFVLLTSRCSFELVEKCAAFGARLLVTISAPTSLAVERARALDLALVALARRDSATVFHGAGRIAAHSEAGSSGQV